MPSFMHLKREEVDEILFYIKYASESASHIEGVNGREWIGDMHYIENKAFPCKKSLLLRQFLTSPANRKHLGLLL